MSLSGRVALVTGASQGIGRTCALKLAASGASVAVAARNQEKLNELVQEITAAGGKAAAFALDVADEDQVKSTVKAGIAQFGKIDILVNNAGITRDQLVMRMKRADWDAVLQTNLTSAYLCIQAGNWLHAQAALGTHHQHHQRLRTDGPGRTGELRRLQGRPHRPDHGDRPRSRLAQHYLQRRRSGIHRNRHDRRC